MDPEVAPDPVAGPVVVVEPGRPQGAAREDVELGAGGPHGEARGGERDVTLEHAGEALPLLGRRRPEGDGAGDVGRAVEVLAAGVDQVEHAGSEEPVGLRGGPIVDDGAARSRPRDRGKADVSERLLLGPEAVEPLGHADLGEPA